MAKRTCPFVDYPRERKLYITTKVMDRELTNNMHEVYERTKRMLFDGAINQEKCQDRNCNVVKLLPGILEDPDSEENEGLLHAPQILRGQCQLDITGRLIPFEKASWGKDLTVKQ